MNIQLSSPISSPISTQIPIEPSAPTASTAQSQNHKPASTESNTHAPSSANTLLLEHPIHKGERSVFELHFQAIKVKHLRAMDDAQGEVGQTLSLVHALTGEPETMLEELSISDYEKVLAMLERLNTKK